MTNKGALGSLLYSLGILLLLATVAWRVSLPLEAQTGTAASVQLQRDLNKLITTLNSYIQGATNADTPVAKFTINATVQQVATGARVLTSITCGSSPSGIRFIQIFDATSTGSVTVGTTVPKKVLKLPQDGASNLPALAIGFANGIQIAATDAAMGSSFSGTAVDTCSFDYK